MNNSIKVRASGTVANVSCGFDCLGYSLYSPFDILEITKNNLNKICITMNGLGSKNIPTDPKYNTAGRAVLSLLSALEINQGFDIKIEKGIPPGSGIGSSACSAVGAVFGVNQLLETPLSNEEILVHAMEGEAVAAGEIHADNVAPSLLGGIVLIRSYDPLDFLQISVPDNLWSTVVLPDYLINTKEARDILPNKVLLKSAIIQSGNLASFILGLEKSDYNLISRSMKDLFAEPFRKKIIPGFKNVKKSALENGAIGCGISGSGPAIFAFSTKENIALKVGEMMQDSFKLVGLSSKKYISKINQNVPEILD